MSDFQAAPLQPIAQCLFTVTGIVPALVDSVGFSAITRVAGPPIAFLLTLDRGLIGNAGEIDPTKARVSVTLRGSPTATPVGSTQITGVGVSYVTPPAVPGPGDAGETQIQLVFSVGGAGVDPNGVNASAVEVVVWKNPVVLTNGPLVVQGA